MTKTIIKREIFHLIVDIAENLLYETHKKMTYEELVSLINKLCIQSDEYDYQKVDPTIRAVCDNIKSCFTNKDGQSLS